MCSSDLEGERGSTSARGASGGRRQLVVGPRVARWTADDAGGSGDAPGRIEHGRARGGRPARVVGGSWRVEHGRCVLEICPRGK